MSSLICLHCAKPTSNADQTCDECHEKRELGQLDLINSLIPAKPKTRAPGELKVVEIGDSLKERLYWRISHLFWTGHCPWPWKIVKEGQATIWVDAETEREVYAVTGTVFTHPHLVITTLFTCIQSVGLLRTVLEHHQREGRRMKAESLTYSKPARVTHRRVSQEVITIKLN